MKDIQVNELKAMRTDYEANLRDARSVIDRLEQELHSVKEQYSHVLEERNKYEDHAQSLQSSAIMAQNQCHQMQVNIRLVIVRLNMGATAELGEGMASYQYFLQILKCYDFTFAAFKGKGKGAGF